MKKNLTFDPANTQALPEGAKHLHGTFYKIPFSAIQVPSENVEDDNDGGVYRFTNPRLLTESGEKELLFGKKSAADLRESITKCTLLNPLVCRWQQDGDTFVPVLVGGDRRYRALDYLIKNNVEVVDPRKCQVKENGEIKRAYCSAREAYDNVVCQVFAVNNDLEALAISWAENKNRINLTDGHEVAEVMKLRKHHASDETILEILQRDEKWLAETERLISKLDEETLDELLEGKIDRSAAFGLLDVPDEKIRKEILNKANDLAEKKHEKKKEQVQKQLKKALDEKEEAEGRAIDLEFSEEKDEESVEEAKAAIEDASKKVKKTLKNRDNLKQTTTSREINKAKAELSIGSDDKLIRCLSARKIQIGIDYLEQVIEDDGVCQRGSFKADVEALKLLVAMLHDNILANDGDFALTLEKFYADSTAPSTAVLDEELPENDPNEDEDDEDWEDEDSDDDDSGEYTGEVSYFE